MLATSPLLIGLTALATVNLTAFLAFGWDKHCARNTMWRVPEANLLMLAFVGGSVGAKLAQHYFRHKTRKQPFRRLLNLILGFQTATVAAMLFPPSRARILEILAGLQQ